MFDACTSNHRLASFEFHRSCIFMSSTSKPTAPATRASARTRSAATSGTTTAAPTRATRAKPKVVAAQADTDEAEAAPAKPRRTKKVAGDAQPSAIRKPSSRARTAPAARSTSGRKKVAIPDDNEDRMDVVVERPESPIKRSIGALPAKASLPGDDREPIKVCYSYLVSFKCSSTL